MDPSYTITLHTHGSGIDKYPAKAHAQRIAAHLSFTKGLILLQGEKSVYYSNSDQLRPLRQDRYFYYLTGCNEPNCFVTYDVGADKLTLWLPEIDLSRVYYDGRGSTVEEAMEKYDVDEAKYIRGKRRKSNLCQVVLENENLGGELALLWMRTDVVPFPVRKSAKTRKNVALRRAMNVCRAVKDENEIALIRKANAVSAEAHTGILRRLHKLKSEPEVEAVYTGTCLAYGARTQSYTPICGSGPNAGQLHYIDNDQAFGSRQTLLVDAGAEWQCYASDVTRTMPINSKHPGHWQSKEAESVYKAVERIQEACIKKLRPGVKFMDVAWSATHMAIDALVKLGILKGEHDKIFHAGTMLAFFPHGLGHHLGLEVHDLYPLPTSNDKDGKEKKGNDVDKRFKNVQEAYFAFHAHNPLWRGTQKSVNLIKYLSLPLPLSVQLFSVDPTQCFSPNTPSDPPLESGNIVTVEPGIYFNEFVLEKFYLNHPVHAKFIAKDVLDRYMSVGGVRIEDDILITKGGYENLTTAPKGEEALRIIRESAEEASSA